MPKVVFDVGGVERIVDADYGESLMSVAVRHGISGILGDCGGACSCATCHVYFDDEQYGALGELKGDEDDLLEMGNRLIEEDDIAFCDFGPVFADWEADFGRTFVLGDDPVKHAIRDILPVLWKLGREYFEQQPDITGADLYDYVDKISREAGYEFGGVIAGHLVGEFPHENVDDMAIDSYIAPKSLDPMRRNDRAGRACHWILEIHILDPVRQFGGFHELCSTSEVQRAS
jgi:ferredoxin